MRRGALALWLAAAACSSPVRGTDSGTAADAGNPALDGGPSDGGPPDGGAPDAGGDAGPSGSFFSGTYSSDAGSRTYGVFVPSGYDAGLPVPMVVVLHGCTETIDQISHETHFSTLAEARDFIVVYPQQDASANSSLCWNWFFGADQARGQGEPELIAGATRQVMGRWSVDSKRVYVTGISAGGAMSVVMGATYPDLFAAIGVVAGCEFQGLPCTGSGGPDPVAQGRAAYQAMGPFARVMPVMAFQGDQDPLVPPVNEDQIIQQWISADDLADDGVANGSIATTPTSSDAGRTAAGETYQVTSYSGPDGGLLMQKWLDRGAGHVWPGGCCDVFTDSSGPDATALFYDFFLAHPMP